MMDLFFCFFFWGGGGGEDINNSNNLNPSCKMDLDFGGMFWKGKTCL